MSRKRSAHAIVLRPVEVPQALPRVREIVDAVFEEGTGFGATDTTSTFTVPTSAVCQTRSTFLFGMGAGLVLGAGVFLITSNKSSSRRRSR